MPNTSPPLTDRETLAQARALAADKAVCEVGLFVCATGDNVEEAAGVKDVVGLKLYMGSSTGSLLVADLAGQSAHFERYPGVVAVHAEGWHLAAAIAIARFYGSRLHCCHVSRKVEIELIRQAKEQGAPVTCEVTPHHLTLTDADARVAGQRSTGAGVTRLGTFRPVTSPMHWTSSRKLASTPPTR